MSAREAPPEMTEQELRRLAELMTELAPKTSGPGVWQITSAVFVGFVGGFLSNAASHSWEQRQARKRDLEASRMKLYQALADYRRLLKSKEENVQVQQEALSRIREAVNPTNDMKFARLLREPNFGVWPIGFEEEAAVRVLEVMYLLEAEGLTATQRVTMELFRPIFHADGALVRGAKWFENRLSNRKSAVDGFLVKWAQRLEKLLRR